MDRLTGTDLHPEKGTPALDYAYVYFLGRDPFAPDYHTADFWLAALHVDPTRRLSGVVFWLSYVHLPYRGRNRFCYLPCAGFHSGPADHRSGNRALATRNYCRAASHPALRLRSGAVNLAGRHCSHWPGPHRLIDVVGRQILLVHLAYPPGNGRYLAAGDSLRQILPYYPAPGQRGRDAVSGGQSARRTL